METNASIDWELVGIPIEKLPDVWPLAYPWLRDVESLTEGKLTVERLADQLTSGQMQLFIVYGHKPVAAIVTEILTYPSVKYCHVMIVAGGGDAKKWHRPIIDKLEVWAKHNGCTRMEMYGRKGWLRLLPEYKVKQYRMTKELA